VSDLARLIDVFEKLRAGQVATVFEDARELRVADPLVMQDTVLATEIKHDVSIFESHVIIAQGRQPKAVILLRVFRVADARQRALHQPNDRRQNLLAR
jgi:hypothetical protein